MWEAPFWGWPRNSRHNRLGFGCWMEALFSRAADSPGSLQDGHVRLLAGCTKNRTRPVGTYLPMYIGQLVISTEYQG
jgi:hypothetical protein